MTNPSFFRWTGAALIGGGLLTIIVNAGITPFLPQGVPFAETAASQAFLWRQGVSAIAAALLLFGCAGLYLRQAGGTGTFGGISFAVALLGTALVLATEWTQLFDIRDLALRAPATLTALDAAPGLSLSDLGAMIALASFTLGWIALAAATFRARILTRWAAALVIAGFFAIPILQAASHSHWGAIAGNIILSAGWIRLGADVRRAAPA
jgi:hypothetical protein